VVAEDGLAVLRESPHDCLPNVGLLAEMASRVEPYLAAFALKTPHSERLAKRAQPFAAGWPCAYPVPKAGAR